jgi:hypothetical protein
LPTWRKGAPLMVQEEQLYTFVADHRGGTFVSQVRAPSIEVAIAIWAEKKVLEFVDIPEDARTAFIAYVTEEAAVPIAGMAGVWCIGPMIDDAMALVNIVHTVPRTAVPEVPGTREVLRTRY